METLHIDGAMGEGGGQVLRTAAGLAARTGTAIEVTDIRQGRSKPGLRPQHVHALKAVAQACGGQLAGAEVGADHVTLEPDRVQATSVRVDPGTAANTLLILQALLPLTPALPGPLVLEASGGTDTKWAPTLVHTRDVLAPLAAKAGVRVDLLEVRHGFYPKGGGRLVVQLHPRSDPAWSSVLTGRGALVDLLARVRIAQLPDHVAQRTLKSARRVLQGAGYEVRGAIEQVEAASPGVVVDAVASFEHTVLGGNAVGQKGVPSEEVGQACGQMLLDELSGPGTVDVHAADQLVPLLYDVEGAGFRVRASTGHLETNLAVASLFLGERHVLEPAPDGAVVRFGA